MLTLLLIAGALSPTTYAVQTDIRSTGESVAALSTLNPDLTDTISVTLSGDILRFSKDSLEFFWERSRNNGEWTRIVTNSTYSYKVKEEDLGYQLRLTVKAFIGTAYMNEVAQSKATAAVVTKAPHSYTVGGKLTSYVDNSPVTIRVLRYEDQTEYTTAVFTQDAYQIGPLPEGRYSLIVSKKHHVTREFIVELGSDFTYDLKICPLGDANLDGKTTVTDYNLAKAHMKGLVYLSGYPLTCADVIGEDDAVTVTDLNMIRGHFMETNPLY